ncbi:MAG: hypothetical protein HC802_02255 [Caldilineaceae bacterium]|nr:hypothetical protein [Caldilineaceae bacterium]
MNPMGKEHLHLFVDDLLAFGADRIGANASAEAQSERHDIPAIFAFLWSWWMTSWVDGPTATPMS